MPEVISNASCLIALDNIGRLRAKKRGVVQSVREPMAALKQAGFRISRSTERHVLKLAGES